MGPSRSPTAALRPAAPHRSLCPELPGPGWVTLIRALLRPAAFPDATEGAAATPARGLKGRCGRGAVRGPVAVRPPTDGADARPAAPRRSPPCPPLSGRCGTARSPWWRRGAGRRAERGEVFKKKKEGENEIRATESCLSALRQAETCFLLEETVKIVSQKASSVSPIANSQPAPPHYSSQTSQSALCTAVLSISGPQPSPTYFLFIHQG